MRGGILALGIIILVITFLFNSYISAQQQSEINLANGLCNYQIGGVVSAGAIGGALSPQIAQDCQNVATLSELLSLSPIAYLVGSILLLAGLVIPGAKKEYTKTSKKRQDEDDEEEKRSSKSNVTEDETLKALKLRYINGKISKKQYREMKLELEEE